jgi:DNA-binding transcriptional LysR family regulator
MDGPAFHRASDIIKDLKGLRLMCRFSTGDEIVDKVVAGEINLIFIIKRRWSSRQRRILREYSNTGTQDMVAKTLDITQQAVSKAIKRSMWKEISGIEDDLNHVLQNHPESLLGEREKDKE